MDIFHYLYQQKFKKGIVPTLDRLKPIYQAIPFQFNQKRIIHVAGTNGKGSTIAFIRSILECAGYTVAAFTSPHLYDITERFYCNGKLIEKSELVTLLESLKERIDQYQAHHPAHFITFFEYMTLAALSWFQQQKPHFILLEVGMGGRFDATNIVDAGIGVITTIGYDHVDYLGNTLEQIAFAKSGIIKTGQRVIIGEMVPSAREVILREIQKQGAVEHRYIQKGIEQFQSGLKGAYQLQNLSTALSVINALNLDIAPEVIHEGVMKTRWAGRYEVLQNDPIVLRDVAHNVMGMEALKTSLMCDYPKIKKIVLFGVMQDKDCAGIVSMIEQFATEIYFVQLPFPRSATLEQIRSVATEEIAEVDPQHAIEIVKKRAKELKGMVIVTGSIYLMEYL